MYPRYVACSKMSFAPNSFANAIAYRRPSREQLEKSTGTRTVLIVKREPFFDCALFSRVTRTGHDECCTIRSAVLPRKKCFNPVRPCVGITTRSAGTICVSRQISSKGGAPLSTWHFADETPHSLATFLSSVSAVCSPFCSYGMKEKGTIGGAGATKSAA